MACPSRRPCPQTSMEALQGALEKGISAEMIARLRGGQPMVVYGSMDMKRFVQHAELAANHGLLHHVLVVCPSAMLSHKSLQPPWEDRCMYV